MDIIEVKPNIYRLKVPFLDIYTTVFFIKTDCGYVMMDTATYPEDIDNYVLPALDVIKIEKNDIRAVVVSHDHRDHAGGLERLADLFLTAKICARSTSCADRVPEREVYVLSDGEEILPSITAVSLPGHTTDCVGIYDSRTKTLLSADGLQARGIFGSGRWGSNITEVEEHIALCQELKTSEIECLITSHDYHPFDYVTEGKGKIAKYLDECVEALYDIRDFIKGCPELDDNELTRRYNEISGLPTIARHVVSAVRKALL